jgi:multiple sugar transport system permease protein/putative aldouronate transport system permease protein
MRGDRLFYFVNDSLLLFAFLLVLYPIVFVFSASFSSPQAVTAGRVWLLPVEPTLEGYRAVFNHDPVLTGYANTVFYTVFGTAFNVFMTVIAAYPLSRKDFRARHVIIVLYTFTMLFSGGLIPTYLLISALGLLDQRLVMILPTGIGVWNLIITRTYFQHTISDDLLDAAKIDGCSDMRFLWKVVLPISPAILAVLTLFYAVGHWNQFFNAFLYLSSEDKFPLQLVLRDILILNESVSQDYIDPAEVELRRGLAELLKYSLIIVASLPVWLVYPFIQKHFVKGVMIGSLKG